MDINSEGSRKTFGLYISEGVFKAFTLYASKHRPIKACEIWEKALMHYMENNPIECLTFEIQKEFSEKIENGIQRELEEKILCKDIEGCLRTLETIETTNLGNFSTVLSELVSAVRTATKIKSPSGRLLSALKKVKESKRLD